MSTPLAIPAPGGIAVGSLSQAWKRWKRYDAVITAEDPRARPSMKLRIDREPFTPQPVLHFEDCDRDDLGIRIATDDQIASALAFARTHATGSLLVHCRHGVGRSAAIALAILADRMGPDLEADAVAALLALRPEATPNLPAVAIADRLLGRDGALAAALAASESTRPSALSARSIRAEFLERNPGEYARI